MSQPCEPVVMRGALLASWEPLSWSQEDWVAAFKVEKIKVRLGEKKDSLTHPQWERFTNVSVQFSSVQFTYTCASDSI